MSQRDASTMAMFGDDDAVSGMIVSDALRATPRAATPAETTPKSPPEPDPTNSTKGTMEERLEQVARLRTKGLITAEEARSRRAELLDEI